MTLEQGNSNPLVPCCSDLCIKHIGYGYPATRRLSLLSHITTWHHSWTITSTQRPPRPAWRSRRRPRGLNTHRVGPATYQSMDEYTTQAAHGRCDLSTASRKTQMRMRHRLALLAPMAESSTSRPPRRRLLPRHLHGRSKAATFR